MKCAVCLIVKKENDYLREFVEHHLNLGYDCVYIYDNNDQGTENAEDVVKDYVDSSQVVIIKFAKHDYAQRKAYNHCYSNYGDEYQWISFIDADEFITLKQHSTIKDFLSQSHFEGFDVIRLNWMCYSDGGHIQMDLTRGVLERFTEPTLPLYNSENKVIKSTVRGGLGKKIKFNGAHFPTSKTSRNCDALGTEQSKNSRYCSNPNFDVAYIAHHHTKTIEEYIINKLRRKGSANRTARSAKCRLTLQYFWDRNEKTPEKIAYAKKIMSTKEYYSCKYYEKEYRLRCAWRSYKYRKIYPIIIKLGLIKR